MVHKLKNEWTYWYSPRGKNSKPDASKNYEINLTKLGDISTLEEFFSYYCYIKKPSEIPVDHKVIFFRKDKKPCWEDWPDGGCWIFPYRSRLKNARGSPMDSDNTSAAPSSATTSSTFRSE